ncbi:MAG: hypothetical protein J0653_06295, partial [Deltaproteobacteria bacterium]|nr:hypothetical protein [Deltaproteobacteria bacterium]
RISLDAKSSLVLSDIAAYYRLGTASLGKDGGNPASFDLLAGVRIWGVGMTLDLNTAQMGRTVSMQKTWVDPIVGARAIFALSEKWHLEMRGGVGGFGISSGITWDAGALVGYSLWDHGTLLMGYRAVGVNHSEGSGRNAFKFDATLHGPIIGLAFTF